MRSRRVATRRYRAGVSEETNATVDTPEPATQGPDVPGAPVDDKAHIRHELDFADAEWITSTEDDDEPGVEIAFVDGYIGMRNGADPDGPVLVFTPEEWDAFVAGAKDGEFDEP